MISSLNRLDDGTVELTLTIPQKQIVDSYKKSLQGLVQKTEIKGFRKGRAPLMVVEKKLGKPAIYEEVLKTLIPSSYIEAVKDHNLKPIINPQISVISLEEGKDWQIKAITCELPKITLGNYRQAVKDALSSGKIWTPKKDKLSSKKPESTEENTDKIFKALLESSRVQIPEILIQEEVNRMLSRLVDQTTKLGITVDQYLASMGKTSDQLRSEYRHQAEESIKLELILSCVADEEKIQVPDSEVERMIQAIPNPQNRKSFENPAQKSYLTSILRKRQALDNLSRL